SVPEERVGIASGVNNAISRLAGLLSIAVLGIIMLRSFNRELSARLDGLELEPGIRQELESQRVRLAAIEVPRSIDDHSRARVRESIGVSFVSGFRVVMFAASGLALLSAATALLSIEGKPKR